MIILDTNLLSELMKTKPGTMPLAWVSLQQSELIFSTSISQAGIFFGLRCMPNGHRRQHPEMLADSILRDDFRGRILPFDADAADRYATIVAARRSMGRPIREFDAQIAAIALSRSAWLATRNVRDFDHLGLDVVNPWDFRA